MQHISKKSARNVLRKTLESSIKNGCYNPTQLIGHKLACLVQSLQRQKGIKDPIIGSYVANASKQILPPVMEGFEQAFPWFGLKKEGDIAPLMEFKVVTNYLELQDKVYGIKIPPKSLKTVFPPLILVPLCGFEAKSKQRIGYGAGYYDRYISFSRQHKIPSLFIGIASTICEFKGDVWDQHDQPLDYIITEEQIY